MARSTYADMILRVDERTLADLCSDTDTPATDLTDNDILDSALAAARGRVNSAVMVSGLYDATELNALTGDDLEFLKNLECDLALASLLRRRASPENSEWTKEMGEQSEALLELIRSGKNIFNVEAKKTAGQPYVDGPTAVDYERLNMIRNWAKPFYGRRHLPIGRE